MRFSGIVGNIFLLDRHLHKKEIITSILLVLIVGVFKFLLNTNAFGIAFDIIGLMYGLLGLSIIYVIYSSKSMVIFIKKYFVLNNVIIGRLILDFGIALSVIVVGEGEIYAWILGIVWMFSGFLRTLLECSKALFDSDIKLYLNMIQIFAYTRAAYLSIMLIYIYNLIKLAPESFLLEFIIMIVMFITCLIYLSNLSPYMYKHENVKKTVLLLRKIKDNNGIKLEALQKSSGLSKEYFDKIMQRYSLHGLVFISRDNVRIGKFFEQASKTKSR